MRPVTSTRFVVMSGLPASGKSTLGHVIADRLGLELIDKDDELEALFDRRSDPTAPADPDERRRLSRAADERFIARAHESSGAVLVSFWRRDQMSATAGTPTDWLGELGDLTEVFCRCAPAIALERFIERRRHPGHGDIRSATAEALERTQQLAAFGPLRLARVIEVNSDRPVTEHDIDLLTAAIGRREPTR